MGSSTVGRERFGMGLAFAVLSLPVCLFLYMALGLFWTLPGPSDPLEYIAPAIWRTVNFDNFIFFRHFNPSASMAYVHWPYLDRIVLVLWLRLVSLLPIAREMVGPIAVLTVNTAILILSMGWVFRHAGTFASLVTGTLLASSYIFSVYATYLYADQMLTFFLLLAFIVYFFDDSKRTRRRRIILTGMLSTFALFSKGLGISAFVFFLGHFFLLHFDRERRRVDYPALLEDIVYYTLAAVGAALIVLTVFAAAFGTSSLRSVFHAFFIESRGLIAFGASRGNLVTYLIELLSLRNLPLFAALFILTGAWHDSETRKPFAMAAVFLTVLTLIYALTSRGGAAILNYVHAPLVFGCMGIGMRLSLLAGMRAELSCDRLNRIAAIVVAGCTIAGMTVAFLTLGNVRVDNFFESGVRFPFGRGLAAIITLAPVGMLALMVASEAMHLRWAAIGFACAAAFWGPVYPGGVARVTSEYNTAEARAYVGAARILNNVPYDRFAVLVDRWSIDDRFKSLDGWRVLWTFHVFFGDRYDRGTGPAAVSRHQSAILGNIDWLSDVKRVVELPPDRVILTDSLATLAGSGYKLKELSTIKSLDRVFHVVVRE